MAAIEEAEPAAGIPVDTGVEASPGFTLVIVPATGIPTCRPWEFQWAKAYHGPYLLSQLARIGGAIPAAGGHLSIAIRTTWSAVVLPHEEGFDILMERPPPLWRMSVTIPFFW